MKIRQSAGSIANVAFVVVALVLTSLIVHKYFFGATPRRPPERSIPTLVKGSQVALAEEPWTETRSTLLLVLKKDCRFCSDSADLYRRLVPITQQKNIRVIAVLPSPTNESREYLKGLGVDSIDIRQASLESLNVRGTPTIILANERGEVVDSWIGRLNSEQETRLITSL